jgi:hypothetical protein
MPQFGIKNVDYPLKSGEFSPKRHSFGHFQEQLDSVLVKTMRFSESGSTSTPF